MKQQSNQEPGGSASQKMTANKISILAEDNALITICNGAYLVIGAAIPFRQIKGMPGVASQSFQRPNDRSRQLGIQQDRHAERGSIR